MAVNLTPTLKSEVRSIRVDELVRDEHVNRILSGARVSKLRSELDVDVLQVPTASERKNKELVLLDGAHRVTSCLEEELGHLKIPVLVYMDLTTAQEAYLFLKLNDRLLVNILERFRLEVTAEDPEATVLSNALKRAGFVLTQRGSGEETRFSAIQALRSIYRGGSITGSEGRLKEVKDLLHIATEAWGVYSSSVSREMVMGIGGLLLDWGDVMDQDHLIESLANFKGGPLPLQTKAKYHSKEGSLGVRRGSERAVAEVYNKGLHHSKKLNP